MHITKGNINWCHHFGKDIGLWIEVEGELCDPEIPPQVLYSRETFGHAHTPRGMYKNADSGAIGNSINLETTQISNNSGRDKLWYFHVMDPIQNEPQLYVLKWANHKTLFHLYNRLQV